MARIPDALLLQRFPVIFDVSEALQILREYEDPRGKLQHLADNGIVRRVRRGLYAVAPEYRQFFPREILANRIYAPSYISFEWALSFHNLIPEQVFEIGSSAMRNSPSSRTKKFDTCEGVFVYRFIPPDVFPLGVRQYDAPYADRRTAVFSMASPEKALADKVFFQRNLEPSVRDMQTYLIDDMRIERESLIELDLNLLGGISEAYASTKVAALARTVGRIRE